MLQTGIIGSVLVAICCFTPALVLLLGVLGLSAWVGWLDHVLLPALLGFLGLIAYGVYLRQRRGKDCSNAKKAP
ncbi:MAG: hypothetical protein COA65_03850 [Rhodospirillaceae bacterium]|nr:MAG: hypothetical protein COA65_03850 [Rhodospirillaceae bacterium]